MSRELAFIALKSVLRPNNIFKEIKVHAHIISQDLVSDGALVGLCITNGFRPCSYNAPIHSPTMTPDSDHRALTSASDKEMLIMCRSPALDLDSHVH